MPQSATYYLVVRKSIPETIWEEKNSGMIHTKKPLTEAGSIWEIFMGNNKFIAEIGVDV